MKFYSRIIVLFSLIVFALSCKTGTRQDNLSTIKSIGYIDTIMTGNYDQKFSLDSISGLKNLFALGAMDSLAGEIQIFDSQSYNSITVGDSIRILNSDTIVNSALLVYAQVADWQQLEVPLSVANMEALVGFIEYDEDLQTIGEEPFLFLIEGVVEQLDWHVINKPQHSKSQKGMDHMQHATRGSLDEVEVEILGVYSRQHEGVYTHKGIPVHMHFRTVDGLLAGHVEDLELGPDMILKVPKYD